MIYMMSCYEQIFKVFESYASLARYIPRSSFFIFAVGYLSSSNFQIHHKRTLFERMPMLWSKEFLCFGSKI
jgi:hypothetical protein